MKIKTNKLLTIDELEKFEKYIHTNNFEVYVGNKEVIIKSYMLGFKERKIILYEIDYEDKW